MRAFARTTRVACTSVPASANIVKAFRRRAATARLKFGGARLDSASRLEGVRDRLHKQSTSCVFGRPR